VPLPRVKRAQKFPEYPKQSIADWHATRRLHG